MKLLLMIVGGFVVLGILGSAAVSFFAWNVARHTRIQQSDGKVSVESPFGTVVSATTPDDVQRNLGVDVYPGARVRKSSAADVSVAGMHTIAADFESDDSPDKVGAFYRKEFPNANVSIADQDHYTIVAAQDKNLVTISIEPSDGKTVIHIANVNGKGAGGSSN